MTAALGWYWLHRARYWDALRWIDRALELPGAGDDSHAVVRVRVLCVQAICQWPVGHGADRGHAIAAEALRIARTIGQPLLLSQALQVSAERHAAVGRLEAADGLAEEALKWAKVSGDPWQIANTSRAHVQAASNVSDLRDRAARAARLLDRAGNVNQLTGLLGAASYVALCMRADDDAARFIERALPLARAMGSDYLWMLVQGNLGMIRLFAGDTRAAADAFRTELQLSRRTA